MAYCMLSLSLLSTLSILIHKVLSTEAGGRHINGVISRIWDHAQESPQDDKVFALLRDSQSINPFFVCVDCDPSSFPGRSVGSKDSGVKNLEIAIVGTRVGR